MQHESSTAATAEEDRSHGFDCNICLDHVKEPVVTLCGHLYCWPCLYRWILNHNQCPVCKAGVTQENIIPVYGRGSKSVDPRKQEPPLGDGVPDRPRGQRPEPISRRRHTVCVRSKYQSRNCNRLVLMACKKWVSRPRSASSRLYLASNLYPFHIF
ncbi:hypothetical protein AC1031_000872 [Aphanomyces cochlioides]|nr:hypothetical protein AC1031_000872 [Aphanomyces cochlioides]